MTQDYQSTHQHGSDHTSIPMGQQYPGGFRGFDDKSIRAAFVSKVFSILSIQLVVASVLIAWFVLHESTRVYFLQYGAPYLYVSFAVGIIIYMVLVCVESARRSFPLNFLLLALLTVSYGMIAAILSARFDTITVLTAFGATAIATISIVLLAKFSPFDITTCGCGLCILALIHLFVGMILLVTIGPQYPSLTALIISIFAAFLLSLYMMFDLQLIMGGRSVELSPEEYILAAVLLYVDIIQLFQNLLIIVGAARQ